MEFHFLGTGNAFGHGGRRRSHYLWEHEETWLIDASYDSLSGLRSLGKSSDNIDRIFLSHLHPDHYMGLPQFALENYYALQRVDPIVVYGPIDVEKTILESTAHFYNKEVTNHVSDLFEFHEVGVGSELLFPTGHVRTLEADHSGNARMQIITNGEISVGYTGDTGFLPEIFDELLECTITISEASSGRHPIPQHTTLQQLINYDIPENKTVYVSHVGEGTIAMKDLIEPPLILSYDGMKINL